MLLENRTYFLGRLSSDRLNWLEQNNKLDLYLKRVVHECRTGSIHPEEAAWHRAIGETDEERTAG